MSTDTKDDYDEVDDSLFNGKPLGATDPDELISVEGEAATGFEPVVETPETMTEPQGDQPPAEPETPNGETGLPPAAIAAMKDERAKRQAAQDELKTLRDEVNQLKGQLQAQAQPAQPQQPQGPDLQTDPEGYIQAQLAAVETQSRLNNSHMLAVQSFGHEAVAEAQRAFEASRTTDPVGFSARYETFGRSPDPIGELVRWHQQQQLLSEIGNDPAAYKEKLKAEIMAEAESATPPNTAAPQKQQPQIPPRMGATPGVQAPGAAQHSMDDAEASLWGR